MADYRELAKMYLENGITTIPVGADKQSLINWTKYQDKHITVEEIEKYFGNCFGIAVLTGGPNGIFCVDIDTKYDLTGSLAERYEKACSPEVLDKLWIQSTMSDGYHWIFKANVTESNQKLASRETTPYEKYDTLMENFNNYKKRETAFNVAANDKVRVLIETRGGEVKDGVPVSKGYFLIAPTPGYKKLTGKLTFLENNERDHLIEEARKFNEYSVTKRDYKKDKISRDSNGTSVFDNFNETGDALALLHDHGWEQVPGNGNYIRLRRPGNPLSKSSALFDPNTRLLNIFTTSTALDSTKTHTPSDLFIELEAGGDTIEAYNMLTELGY